MRIIIAIAIAITAATAQAQWTWAFMDTRHPSTMTKTEFRHGIALGFSQLDDALEETFRRVKWNESPIFKVWVNDTQPQFFGTAYSDLRGGMHFGTGIFISPRDTVDMRVSVAALLVHEMLSHTMTGAGNEAHRLNDARDGFRDEYRSGIRGFDKTIAQDDRDWLAIFGWHPKPTINRWNPLMTLRNRPPTVVSPRNKMRVDRGRSRANNFNVDNHDPEGDELTGKVIWVRHGAAVVQGDGQVRYWARTPDGRPLPKRIQIDTVVVAVLEAGNPNNSALQFDRRQWEVIEIEVRDD